MVVVIRWKDRPPGGAMLPSSGVRRRATPLLLLLLPTQPAVESRQDERMEGREGRYDGQTRGRGELRFTLSVGSAGALMLSDLLY